MNIICLKTLKHFQFENSLSESSELEILIFFPYLLPSYQNYHQYELRTLLTD